MEAIQSTLSMVFGKKNDAYDTLRDLAGNPKTTFTEINDAFNQMEETEAHGYFSKLKVEPSAVNDFHKIVQLWIHSPSLFTDPPERATFVNYGTDGFTRNMDIESFIHQERIFIQKSGEEIDMITVPMHDQIRVISKDRWCMIEGTWYWINTFISEAERDPNELNDYFKETFNSMLKWLSKPEEVNELMKWLQPLP